MVAFSGEYLTMNETQQEVFDKAHCHIYLYKPDSFFGDLCTWRLESPYSHSAIQYNGFIYSAIYPHAVKMGIGDVTSPHRHELGMPPRHGDIYSLMIPKDKLAIAQQWCEDHLTSKYDLLSLVGWALRIPALQSPGTFYCFEFVHSSLVAAGLLPLYKSFITAEQLLVDCYDHGLINPLDPEIIRRAKHQKPPVVRTKVK